LALVVITVLVIIDFYIFFFGDYVRTVDINEVSFNERMRIDLNISIFNIPCDGISIELLDMLENYRDEGYDNIHRIPIDKYGRILNDSRA
jgi:hypothetical protein